MSRECPDTSAREGPTLLLFAFLAHTPALFRAILDGGSILEAVPEEYREAAA